MNYTTELRVSEEDAHYLEKLCREPNEELSRDYPVFDRDVKFADGMIMAIQVISSENPENESCWVQGVLYEPVLDKARGITFNGEAACTEVKETFLGKYEIGHNGNKYIVEVLIEDEVVV